MRIQFCVRLLTLANIFACSQDPSASDPFVRSVFLGAEKQTRGDADRGKYELLNGTYMSCGMPYKLWENSLSGPVVRAGLAGALGGGEDAPTLAGRTGKNATMPYFLNVFETESGAEVINSNCLSCHGGEFDGQLVLGLGNATGDFTDLGGVDSASTDFFDDGLLEGLGLNAAEIAQFRMMFARARPLTQYKMRTVGHNPAEMFAVVLAAHHDLHTLAWSDVPLIDLVVVDHFGQPIDDPIVTSDPPPWWRAHKKNALFYNGMARGDHRGTMALATSFCVDTVERAQKVDKMFEDIQAYVDTIRAPVYTRTIDGPLAEQGKELFDRDCAICHGTYGATETDDTYPNLLIALGDIGTDPVVAEAGVVHAPQMVQWYNASFYGQITRMAPSEPYPGYMPPPLDGIWATAPFFHNGSVPTVDLVLNSPARPTYWKRNNYDSTIFDEVALGWPYTELNYSQADAPTQERKHVYDTTYWSQSNKGHTFGDHLTARERRAVIEYLKTL